MCELMTCNEKIKNNSSPLHSYLSDPLCDLMFDLRFDFRREEEMLKQ